MIISLQSISAFCITNKDVITIILAVFAGIITLATFIKAIIEYRLQGRQKRAELFDKFKTLSRTEPRIATVYDLLESNNAALSAIPMQDRYYFLGFYEQLAIAVNSGLIKENVAHYMFGYFAIRCQESTNFWNGLNQDSYYWSVFNSFANKMKQAEKRNIDKSFLTNVLDFVTNRSYFKY